MKKWNNPEIKELNITNTEGTYLNGYNADGEYFQSKVDGSEVPLTSDGSLIPDL